MAKQFSMNARDIPFQKTEEAVNIIDTLTYTNNFEEIITYIKSEEMQELKKNNNDMYWNRLNLKNDGRISHKIIDLLDEDLENEPKIRNMLGILGKCKTGEKNIEDETKNFDEYAANTYLYPSFGGEEGFKQAVAKATADAEQKKNEKKPKLDSMKKARFAGGKRV